MKDNELYEEYENLMLLGILGRDVEYDEWLCNHDIF